MMYDTVAMLYLDDTQSTSALSPEHHTYSIDKSPVSYFSRVATCCCAVIAIQLTKITAGQNDVALSYHRMREQYFLAAILAGTIILPIKQQ